MASNVVKSKPLEDKALAGLKRIAWRARKDFALIMDDPFVENRGGSMSMYGQVRAGRDGAFMMVPGKVVQILEQTDGIPYASEVRIQINLPLKGEGVEGRTTPEGTEEEIEARYARMMSNDIGHAVPKIAYGADYQLKHPTEIDETNQEALITWSVEKEGLQKRQALLENVSSELKVAPTSQAATFNANILLPNLDLATQPAYHPTPATHALNIRTAMDIQSSAATHLTITNCITLANQLNKKYMRPAKIGGRRVWLLYLHPDEFAEFENQGINGSWGSYVKDMSALPDWSTIQNVLPHAEKIISDRLIVLKDEKAPILGWDGDVPTGVLTPGYKKFEEVDDRDTVISGNVSPFRCNEILGESALVKHAPVDWEFKYEKSGNYGKDQGIFYRAQQSFQTLRYDVDTASITDATLYQRTSAIFLTAAKSW